MTQQYNRSLLAPVVILPTGQRQPYGQILDYDYNVTTGSKITINRVAGSAIAFTPNNPASVLAQLDRIPSQTASAITIMDVSSLTFVSVSPNTFASSDVPIATVTGTGFMASNINLWILDNGVTGITAAVTSVTDTTIGIQGSDPFIDVGTFTLYYSTDAGVTRTTTGLTVTVS